MKMKTSMYLMLCSMSLLCACGEKKQTMPGEKYKTLTVETSNQTLQSTYPASLRGQQSVEIRPQVSGTITDIRINEGDLVRKGQVLFIIDQVPYKAALETALANVKSAEAKLQTARLTANSKEELFKENIVSDFDRQTARNQLLEAEAALAQAKAEETNARNNLSYTEVKSPVDGVASMIPYRIGALVNSSISEPLVTVSDDSQIYAYFSMAESQMLDLIQQYGSLEEAKEKVELQVSQAAFKAKEAAKTLEMSKSNLDKAEENLRQAQIGYREGVMPIDNVMAAQTAWLKANSEHIDAGIDVQLCDVYLSKVLGTLTY